MIRPATPADLDGLAELCAALWPGEDHRDWVAATLAGRPPSTLPLAFFVAIEDGRVVGFVEVGLRSHANGCDGRQPVGFVEGWYVVPEWRRRGLGRALVAAGEKWARARGCVEMGSDTWADNLDSERAHLALGYAVVDRCINFRKPL